MLRLYHIVIYEFFLCGEVMNIKFKHSKVMLICTTDNMIWQFLVPHIRQLRELGADVDCICAKTGFWFDELRDSFGFNMIDITMKRTPVNLTNLKAYKQLIKLTKENKYDVIYCQQPVGGMMGRFIGRKFKLPVIYTAHGFFFFKGNNPIKNFIYRTAEKIMSRWTDAIITMNFYDYNAAVKFKAKSVHKINGIGLNPKKFSNEKFDPDAFRKELGIKKNEKVILSVSEFIKRKNYATMLQSFAELCKTRKDVKYILVGTGKLIEQMKALADTLGIRNKVIFTGYRKDIDKIMKISDVFFHQSFHEGLTMGIIEAMYFGLPVVASNVRGNAELIMPQGGILTHSKDVQSHIIALNHILNDPEMARKMSEFNKNHSKQYLLPVVQEQLLDVYKHLDLI